MATTGAEIDARAGMFGRRQIGAQAGAQSGNVAIYGAFEGINDDGFRDFSDTESRRGYADLGFKGTGSEFHLNYTGATGEVGVTAAVPEELLAFGGRTRTFTSPQITDNDMQMFSANGVVELTPTTVAFRRDLLPPLPAEPHRRQHLGIRGLRRQRSHAGLCTEEGDELYRRR